MKTRRRLPDIAWSEEWDLASIPDDLWRREHMRRVADRPHPRMVRLRPCPHCAASMSTREWRVHKGRCPKNPRVRSILDANRKQEGGK